MNIRITCTSSLKWYIQRGVPREGRASWTFHPAEAWHKGPPGLWATQTEGLERDRMERGGARSKEEGLTGTYAFSLQWQRGEPQGHRATEQPLWPRTEGQRQGCAIPRALCAGPRAAARGQRGPCPGQVPAEGSDLTGCQLGDTDVSHPRKQG